MSEYEKASGPYRAGIGDDTVVRRFVLTQDEENIVFHALEAHRKEAAEGIENAVRNAADKFSTDKRIQAGASSVVLEAARSVDKIKAAIEYYNEVEEVLQLFNRTVPK